MDAIKIRDKSTTGQKTVYVDVFTAARLIIIQNNAIPLDAPPDKGMHPTLLEFNAGITEKSIKFNCYAATDMLNFLHVVGNHGAKLVYEDLDRNHGWMRCIERRRLTIDAQQEKPTWEVLATQDQLQKIVDIIHGKTPMPAYDWSYRDFSWMTELERAAIKHIKMVKP